ncbi:hypothetical protein DXG01_012315, partial [Tephrocybe rancida]
PPATALEDAEPPYPSIYRGLPTKEKYAAILRATIHLVTYPNPFNSFSVGRRVEPPPPSSSKVNRQARSAQYSPYAKRKAPNIVHAPQGRDKFEDPDHEIYPPPIPTWRSALHNIDRAVANLVNSEQSITDSNYAFPDPASIVSIENPERRKACFETWLKYRTALIHRFNSPSSNARPMASKAWRILLSINYLENTNARNDTRSAQRRQLLQDFLANAVDALELNSDATAPATWQGKPMTSLQNADYEEILQELLALDARVLQLSKDTGRPLSSRMDMICACFPSGQILVAALHEANQGLASLNRDEQCRYLLAMRSLMKTWPGKKPAIMELDQLRWRDPDIDELEMEIARYYTQTFFNYFKRAPVIPRRLSHNVPGMVVPPHILKHLNPAPMVFYDMDYLYTLTDFEPLPKS